MSEFLDDTSFDQPPAKRPVFLTVIGILTFVSCGLTLLTSVYGLIAAGNTQQAMRASQQSLVGTEMGGIFTHIEAFYKWTIIANYLSIANCLICLAGALLMWNLRKAGFFLYCFGQVLPFISIFGLYSAMQDIPALGIAVILWSVVLAVFSIGFIVMYAVNLKYMHK